MLGQRRRGWSSIGQTLGSRVVFAERGRCSSNVYAIRCGVKLVPVTATLLLVTSIEQISTLFIQEEC